MQGLLLELNSQITKDKIKISPIGTTRGIDGRVFKIDGEKLIKNIQKNGLDIPLNLNHQGGEAYGWFDKDSLELRNDGVYANLELTPNGKKLVEEKAFRYLSPEYYVDNDKNVITLDAMGLVNQLNLLNKALNKIKTFFKERNTMNEEELKKIEDLANELEEKADENTQTIEKTIENSQDQNVNEELLNLKQENEELKAKITELSLKLEQALNKNEETFAEFNKKRLDSLLQNGLILPNRYQKALNMKGEVLEEYLNVYKEEARVILGKKEFNIANKKRELNALEVKVFKQLGIKGDK
ncbi:phage protease [Campylobacter lari]|uniref:phage protease n=1 Tax=Campylobacter lari TaxID=201 RepID=UPI002152FA53|nr:phage protease [Campylobacter lari]MCR6526880.1 phage protease [Campylobacter lari]